MSEDFGSYRLVERIGGGSLGEVFRAESDSRPPVALKRLARAHLESPEWAEALCRESEIAEKMQHERLLGALDRGAVAGWPFLTQRLATQGSLLERLSPGLAREELAAFATDFFEALGAVHALGYAHCDLSPGNLLFEGGRALLADFSVATEIGTRQEKARGTYAFMSPEQVKGETIDARSDVFSSANLLWLCATGQRVFLRPAQHLSLHAVVSDEPRPLPDAMAAIDKALRPALAKDKAERPSDLLALRDAFIDAIESS